MLGAGRLMQKREGLGWELDAGRLMQKRKVKNFG